MKAISIRLNLLVLCIFMGILILASPSASLPTEIFIFAIAASGFNVLYGMAGLLSFGQSIFFGGAAYICGIIGNMYPLGALSLTLVGGLSGLIIALAFSIVTLRSRGIYFVMLTLALGQVGFFLVLALKDYTGGENGLATVVRPDISLFGYVLASLQSPQAFLAYSAVILVLAMLFTEVLQRSALGSVLAAVRLNQSRTEVLGYRTRDFRIAAFLISGFMAGVSGSLYAMFLRFVPLNTVDVETAEKLVIMTIVGGVGTTLGPLVGSALFLLAADLLSPIWPRWMMIMGVLLVLIIMAFKGGVINVIEDRLNARARHLGRKAARPTAGDAS